MDITVSATRCKANYSPYFPSRHRMERFHVASPIATRCTKGSIINQVLHAAVIKDPWKKDGGIPIFNIIQYCSLKGIIMSCIWHLASRSPYGNCLNKGICRHIVLPAERILSERCIEGKQKISTATWHKAKEKEIACSRISRLSFRDLRSVDWVGSQVEVLDEGLVTSQARVKSIA